VVCRRLRYGDFALAAEGMRAMDAVPRVFVEGKVAAIIPY
jgi:hypothetical protein